MSLNSRLRANGSALLLTLIFLVGVGGIVLTVTRVVLDASRLGSNADNYQIASRAADSGLQAGMVHLAKNPPDATNLAASWGPITQGFRGSSCDSLSLQETALPPNTMTVGCPWFWIQISPDIQSVLDGGVILGDSDLPVGKPVTFRISSPVATQLTMPSSYGGIVTCTAVAPMTCPAANRAGGFISLPFGTSNVITLTRVSSTLGAGGITVGNARTVMTKIGYDCVSAVGYSGTVTVEKRLQRTYAADGSFADTVLEGSLCSDHLPSN